MRNFTSVNGWDVMPLMLLVLFSMAASVGVGVIVLVARRARSKSGPQKEFKECPYASTCVLRRPGCWLAIKSRNLAAVQTALGLDNAKPCSWIEGLTSDEKLFIAPPIKGWILVMGSGLPDPSEDPDACFRFLTGLSRRLGHVQDFCASRVLNHHAWVRAERGRVIRAYAWAGRTVWKQGRRTAAERDLNVQCFDYTDTPEKTFFGEPDVIGANVDKVPLLASRWSLDPARVDERFLENEHGVAGEPSHRY